MQTATQIRNPKTYPTNRQKLVAAVLSANGSVGAPWIKMTAGIGNPYSELKWLFKEGFLDRKRTGRLGKFVYWVPEESVEKSIDFINSTDPVMLAKSKAGKVARLTRVARSTTDEKIIVIPKSDTNGSKGIAKGTATDNAQIIDEVLKFIKTTKESLEIIEKLLGKLDVVSASKNQVLVDLMEMIQTELNN